MRKIMYKRTSKLSQKMDRQTDLESKYNPDLVYEEKVSGAKEKRPQLEKMINELEKGDIVIVESLSRLGRNLKNILDIVDYFDKNNIKLISDKENIDTKSAMGKAMFNFIAVLSQLERELLIERTQEGLKSAKEKGVKLGRPKIDIDIFDKAFDLYSSGKYSVDKICKQFDISRTSFYREKNKRSC